VSALSLSVVGRVISTRTDTDPDRIRVRVARVVLSNGWLMRPARAVTFSVPFDATVSRRSPTGTLAAARFADLAEGQLVTVASTEFAQTLAFARALPGAHAASTILIRG
jgi:hypothetical protein